MPATVDVQKWVESQEYPIPLDQNGKFETVQPKSSEYAFRFEDLYEAWRSETAGQSSLEAIILNDNYFGIIALGEGAIPFLLRKLEEKPVNVFHALRVLTRANPVEPKDQGNLERMAAAWLAWGKSNNFIG